MTVRYVFWDGSQRGTYYVTRFGIHVITGQEISRFFRDLGQLGEEELIFHPEDPEGDRFIELARPRGSRSDVERLVEKALEENGYDISPNRF